MSSPQQPGQPYQHQPGQPPYQGPPPPMPPAAAPGKPKRFGFVALAVAAVAGLFVGGMIGGLSSGATTSAVPAPAPTVTITETAAAPEPEAETEEPAEEQTEDPAPAAYKPKKSDWKVNVKETGKQCFGSAGCNVELGIEPEFVGDSSTLPTSGTIEVTFELTGTEDPFIDTFTVEDKQISWTKEASVQTTSKGKDVKAKVTDVEYNTY